MICVSNAISHFNNYDFRCIVGSLLYQNRFCEYIWHTSSDLFLFFLQQNVVPFKISNPSWRDLLLTVHFLHNQLLYSAIDVEIHESSTTIVCLVQCYYRHLRFSVQLNANPSHNAMEVIIVEVGLFCDWVNNNVQAEYDTHIFLGQFEDDIIKL